MSGVPLRVLAIEASEPDFHALVAELENSGYDPFCLRIQSHWQFRQALREKWDVILANYEAPRFNIVDALRVLHEKSLDIPFIVVSPPGSSCEAREIIKAGANDCLRKDELGRLHVALDRELRAAEGRRERRHLEEQLRHAQRLEAVGRLAGGMAHDFNNLLTIISGYSELLLAGDDLQRSQRAALDEIRRAAQRGGALTHQLLAFSRRQPMATSIVALNDLLIGIEKMLRPLIGEDIELVTLPVATRDTVKSDSSRLEQVIMNIAVNARDAMPNGGKLTIESSNVYLDEDDVAQYVDLKPGPYVVLTIADTGVGMDDETRSHLFEPFFTTKAHGRGTGLGLATAYGIVRQSGGSISVASEPGRGAKFTIYLPLSAVEAGVAPGPDAVMAPCNGCETVLLVEDEPRVRKLIADLLAAKGYRVLEAGRGEEALRMAELHPGPIHLALLDVVMPEMSGPEVGRQISARRPETRLLYISGYTDEAIVQHGLLDIGANFLQKPFLPQTLAARVREVLDSGDGESAAAQAS